MDNILARMWMAEFVGAYTDEKFCWSLQLSQNWYTIQHQEALVVFLYRCLWFKCLYLKLWVSRSNFRIHRRYITCTVFKRLLLDFFGPVFALWIIAVTLLGFAIILCMATKYGNISNLCYWIKCFPLSLLCVFYLINLYVSFNKIILLVFH